MNFLRFVMLLAIAVWIGALSFFPFVAQTSFSALPSQHIAGLVVRDALRQLHWLGLGAGIIFLLASLFLGRLESGRARLLRTTHVLVVAMMALTAISQFQVIPRMERLRIAAGDISELPATDPIRAQFDSLHLASTRIEGAVLLLAVLLLYFTRGRLAGGRA
jgi:hypothetical protein